MEECGMRKGGWSERVLLRIKEKKVRMKRIRGGDVREGRNE